MKHCFKNYLKLGVLLFGISCFVISCQKDDEEVNVENSDNIQDILSRTLNLEDIPHFTAVSQKINKIHKGLNSKDSSLFRTLNADSTTIITNNIIYMTYDDSHTYTFKLFRSNPEYYIENLVLHFNTDTQNYDEYLLQYDITEQEFLDFSNNQTLSEITNVLISELDQGTFTTVLNRSDCFRVCQTISVPCAYDGDQGEPHEYGDSSCQYLNDPSQADKVAYQYQSCGTTCIDTGSDDETIDDGDSTGGGGKVVTNPNTQEPCIMANGQVGILAPNGDCVKKKELEDPHTRNCEKLQEFSSNAQILQSYQALHQIVIPNNIYHESGYSFALDANPLALELSATNSLNILPLYGGLIYGLSHTHPFEHAGGEKVHPMFSVEDIFNLGFIAARHSNPGTAIDPSLFVLTLTVKQGATSETFALKISDWFQFFDFLNDYSGSSKESKERLNRKLNKKYNQAFKQNAGNVASNYLKIMFKFMTDNDISGVEVYKAVNSNLSDWEKLNYDPENKTMLDPTPCNN